MHNPWDVVTPEKWTCDRFPLHKRQSKSNHYHLFWYLYRKNRVRAGNWRMKRDAHYCSTLTAQLKSMSYWVRSWPNEKKKPHPQSLCAHSLETAQAGNRGQAGARKEWCCPTWWWGRKWSFQLCLWDCSPFQGYNQSCYTDFIFTKMKENTLKHIFLARAVPLTKVSGYLWQTATCPNHSATVLYEIRNTFTCI